MRLLLGMGTIIAGVLLYGVNALSDIRTDLKLMRQEMAFHAAQGHQGELSQEAFHAWVDSLAIGNPSLNVPPVRAGG